MVWEDTRDCRLCRCQWKLSQWLASAVLQPECVMHNLKHHRYFDFAMAHEVVLHK